ncbi:MAG: amidase [Chthoniobacterales bacterium]
MKNRCLGIKPSVLAGLLFLPLLSSCSIIPVHSHAVTRDRAFISYTPPSEGGGLRLAIKDLIDIKGEVTSAGSQYMSKNTAPATDDAACMALARARGVQIVGKTNLTEFAVTVSGTNRYFGTPINRLDGKHKFIPGGSSSGSAVAVADGMADVAFGTDTGGSIRFPAACCGVLGLKTTFGLISTKGIFPVSPKHLDTVGPMAKDIPRLVQGMDLLQEGFAGRYQNAVANHPSARGIRIGRLYLDGTDPAINKAIDEKLAATGFRVVTLDPSLKAKWRQAEKDGRTVAIGDAWFHDHGYTDQSGISATTKLTITDGSIEYPQNFKAALKRQAAWQRELSRVFRKVDFIALPTMQNLPPRFPPFDTSVAFELLVFNMQNTLPVNFAGNPALAIPVPMPVKKRARPIVTSLQLIGPRLSEAQLVNAGRLLETKR